MTSIDDLFARAKADHQGGRVPLAERAYRQVLQADPGRVAAWYLLGVACHTLGRHAEAASALEQALRLRPDHAEARNHLGIVRAQSGQLDAAVACFQEALRLRPDLFDAHRNLALAFERLGQLDAAIASYRATLRLRPDLVEIHRSLAALLRKQGKRDEAIAALREAQRLRPDVPETHHDLGILLEHGGKPDEAVSCYRAAIQLRPGYAEAYSSLGVALDRLGQSARALECVREAVRLQPDFAGGLNNLGVLLEKRGDWREAEACFRQALRLDSRFLEALYNLASVLGKLGAFDEAEALGRQAVAVRPQSAEAHHNLAFVLAARGRFAESATLYRQAIRLKPDFVDPHVNLASVLGKLGRLEEAEAACREAIRLQPDRAEAYGNLGFVLVEQGRIAESSACYREALRLQPGSPTLRSGSLYGRNYDPDADPATLLDEHRQWGQTQHAAVAAGAAPTLDRDRDRDRPLRVGYLSPDLRAHPVAFFLRPILAHHDRRRIEATCYADLAAPDAVSEQLRGLSQAWRPTYGLTDAQVVDRIRGDRIDILVDLAGHTGNHRLGVFARKPAPVQVTYLGYPNTTGLTTIDYLLTDAVADPPDAPAWSTEEPFHLPRGFCCYSAPEDAPAVAPLPARSTGAVTFGSLHKLPKLNRAVLDLWADLLAALPSARLLLFRNNLQGRPREQILAHFEGRGIDPQRLDLRHAIAGGGSHLGVYQDIDIALDVFPWCGHTTACEALWMGVPVVTLAGHRHASRMTASVLTTLGMPELIATTRAGYLELARDLAGDLDRLEAIRTGLRARMRGSRLCDGEAFTRDLEAAYRAMWQRWCDNVRK